MSASSTLFRAAVGGGVEGGMPQAAARRTASERRAGERRTRGCYLARACIRIPVERAGDAAGRCRRGRLREAAASAGAVGDGGDSVGRVSSRRKARGAEVVELAP